MYQHHTKRTPLEALKPAERISRRGRGRRGRTSTRTRTRTRSRSRS